MFTSTISFQHLCYYRCFLSLLTISCFLSSFSQTEYFYTSSTDSIPLLADNSICAVSFKGPVDLNYLNSLEVSYSEFNLNLFIVNATLTQTSLMDLNDLLEEYIVRVEPYGNERICPNRIVVRYHLSASSQDKSAVEQNHSLTATGYSQYFDQYDIVGNPFQTCRDLYQSAVVRVCGPDFFLPYEEYSEIPNDTYFHRQWNLNSVLGTQFNDNVTGTIDADIDSPEAWELTTGSINVPVAICEAGVLPDHEDLPYSKQILFGMGYSGAVAPHGIAVAGIVGADINNCKGIVGVSPASRIMPVPIDFYGANISGYMNLIIESGENGARILNFSNSVNGIHTAGDPLWISCVDDLTNNPSAIPNYGGQACTIVAGVGSTADIIDDCFSLVLAPSVTNSLASVPNVFLVGASDRNNQLADYSHFGPGLTIAAPSATDLLGSGGQCDVQVPGEAENHWTLDLPGSAGYNPYPFGSASSLPQNGEQLPGSGPNHLDYTGRFYGTSAATPQVSGVAGLCLGANSCLSTADIWNVITSSADEVGPYTYVDDGTGTGETRSDELGYGRLNAHQAVIASLALGEFDFDISISDYICTSGDNAVIQFTDNTGNIVDVKVNGQSVDILLDINVPFSSDGKYYVQAIKADGCYSYREIWPESIVDVDLVSVSNTCPDLASGAVDVELTPQCNIPYSISWSNNEDTEDVSNLLLGEYILTISQTNGCVHSQSYMVEELTSESEFTPSAQYCMSDGVLDLVDFITWADDGALVGFSGSGVTGNSFDPSGLSSSEITMNYTEDGCSWTITEPIEVLPCCVPINIQTASIINECPGVMNGGIDLTVSGGTPPYSFSWSNGSDAEDLNNVQYGTYSVDVTDANGCFMTQNIEVDYDLPATMDEFFDQQVNVSATWDIEAGEYGFLEDMVIENGGVVDISPGATLRFAPNAGIIVETGGMLIMNGATLTRFDCNPNFWQGIDVHDDGTVLTWDSFAEFALIGINNYDRSSGPANTAGGNISCWTTEFTDCQSAVRLRRKNGTSSYSSLASFRDCDFTWTNNLPYVNSFFPQPLIDSKESTVNFVYCDFTNENDELLSLTINHTHNPAIYSYLTRLTVIGDDASSMRNKMTGFRHGIVQHGGRAYVDQMDFNNFRSAYVVSSKGSRFTQNNFGILSETRLPLIVIDTDDFAYKTMYGLYLESSTAFWVEDNEFFLAWPDEQDPYGVPPTIPDFPYTAGLFVRGSGPAQNQIYRNRFYYNDDASIAYDDNRNDNPADASGLKYTCNEFYYNDNGVNVVSTVNNYNPGWGIHSSQGVAPDFPLDGISAGNYFEGQTVNDLRLDGNLPTFSYYWHPTDVFGFSLATEGDINEVDQGISQYNNGQGCPSKLTRTRSTRSASADLNKQAAEQLRMQYQLMVDGGDTEGLLSEVVLTQYGEALELYYELMSKSPHLSEEVMIEAIQKETELPAALLTLILESNPQAAKSKEVEEKLDDRMMPLEEYQRYMIEQGKYLLSDKEMLEARIAYHESEQHSALGEIIIEIMIDSTIVDKRAEIDAEVLGRESLDVRYLRIDLALEDGDLATAQSLLDNIPSDIPLRGLKDQEYLDFVTCYELLVDLLTTEGTTLSQAQEDDLYLITVKHSTRASGFAQILLTEYTNYLFDEVLVDPETTAKSRRSWDLRKPKFTSDPSLKIYPNPAADHLMLEFKNWGGQVDLELRDAAGRLVRNEIITSSKTAYILDISELSEGSYTLLLRALDGNLTEQRPIEVVR